jgi:CheY-like chemotaxis protein
MRIQGRSILIVEDEPIIALALEDLLVGQGATVHHASHLEDAHRLLASVDLDVKVHGCLSYPVATELKERSIPFIFATGYGDGSHPEEFECVPTIAKPYSAEEIGRALAQSAASPSA